MIILYKIPIFDILSYFYRSAEPYPYAEFVDAESGSPEYDDSDPEVDALAEGFPEAEWGWN